jgi:hypothetical protein
MPILEESPLSSPEWHRRLTREAGQWKQARTCSACRGDRARPNRKAKQRGPALVVFRIEAIGVEVVEHVRLGAAANVRFPRGARCRRMTSAAQSECKNEAREQRGAVNRVLQMMAVLVVVCSACAWC